MKSDKGFGILKIVARTIPGAPDSRPGFSSSSAPASSAPASRQIDSGGVALPANTDPTRRISPAECGVVGRDTECGVRNPEWEVAVFRTPCCHLRTLTDLHTGLPSSDTQNLPSHPNSASFRHLTRKRAPSLPG